jgi:hypothetical protein
VPDAKSDHEPTLVERWLQEQQEWQRTLLTYVDSMVKSDEFLVNVGNAMRGSLLAGKAYPTAGTTPTQSPGQNDERLDRILFALNTLQGQVQDLFMSIEDIRKAVGTTSGAAAAAPASATATGVARVSAPPASKATSKRARPARRAAPRPRKARA